MKTIAESQAAIEQIMQAPAQEDFLFWLLSVITDTAERDYFQHLITVLSQRARKQEEEVESLCFSHHQGFLSSSDRLTSVQHGTKSILCEIADISQQARQMTQSYNDSKLILVDLRKLRLKLVSAMSAVSSGLDILRSSNNVHELLRRKSYYAAVRALSELQQSCLRTFEAYDLNTIIQSAIPKFRLLIAKAVMTDLNTWLFRLRETSQYLGEVAFFQTEQRRTRQKQRSQYSNRLVSFRINSAVELVSDECDEYDILHNDDVHVDFTPIFECLHIQEVLGQAGTLREEYRLIRQQQKDLLLPSAMNLTNPEDSSLHDLLESITGFIIIERFSLRMLGSLRCEADVDQLWLSISQRTIGLISSALPEVSNAEILLRIKTVLALFIQTADSWGYPVAALDTFMIEVFRRYSTSLKRRFGDDFKHIVATDDYMPMPISKAEEYEKVVSVSWYVPTKARENLQFPCVLPFSQMYPLCCIDIRNFLNQFYYFQEDYKQNHRINEELLKNSLDELLSNSVCQLLVERLDSQYLGQIVQILINLEHFEIACGEIELLLAANAAHMDHKRSIPLQATARFRNSKKTAEKRIFELVNSKIDDLVETAEYDWTSSKLQDGPSSYIQILTRYLSNIMNSVLLGLPAEIKELIYFDALSHASSLILNLPLSDEVKQINQNGVGALAQDVQFLTSFVDTLDNPILQENLDELQQTVLLMQNNNVEEFFEAGTRNKIYGRVNTANGPLLLEKLVASNHANIVTKGDKLSSLSSRLRLKPNLNAKADNNT